MDRFAGVEGEAVRADVHRLPGERYQVHLDAARSGVVEGIVREAPQVEVSAQLAIDAPEQVQVEGRGDALRVVVGGMQDVGVLLQVHAHQHPAGLAARHGEEGLRLLGREIADGRAGEIHRAAASPALHGKRQGPRKIAHHRHDIEPREFARETPRRRLQRVMRDVDRDVGRGTQRADQQARLHACAAAVLDESASAPGKARDGGDMRAGQRKLGARQVILAQPADALEQPAARRVVEVLGGKALAGQRKPRDDVFAKAA